MTAKRCPLCGENTLEEKRGEFRFDPPQNIPGGTMVISDAAWEQCSRCGERILAYDLDKAIDREANKRQGLLTPEEIERIRQETGLSTAEMANKLNVDEKTIARWETGKSIQPKEKDKLIRALVG